MFVSINSHCCFQAANRRRLGNIQNFNLCRMAQYIYIVILFVVKNVILHSFISSFIGMLEFFLFLFFFFSHQFRNQNIHGVLLFFAHSVDDIDNRFLIFFFLRNVFLVFGFFFFILRFFLFFLFLIIFCRVIQRNFFTCIDGCLTIFDIFAVSNGTIDICAGISSSQYKTDFLNIAVHYISALLCQLISPDRHCDNVSMSNHHFDVLRSFGIIKET